jgi:hypothetical protein
MKKTSLPVSDSEVKKKAPTRWSIEVIRAWAQRHDIRGSITEQREIFEDAATTPPDQN